MTKFCNFACALKLSNIMLIHDDNSINFFFSLLRSGMYGVPVPESELPEKIDWKSIVMLAHKHVVLGIIIDSVQFLPERLRPSASTLAKMNKFALGLIQTNVLLDKTVARLVSFLKQHGIDGVLLKGQGVARYYRVPQMRQCGDIDFYIGPKRYKKAVAICKERLVSNKTSCSETYQHFDFELDKVTIELHRIASVVYSPIRNRRFQKWVVDELEHSIPRRKLTIGDVDVEIPSIDFDAIFIFYHAWRHYIMGGIGVRQLCDWAMIFHQNAGEIDVEKLKDNINRFGMTIGWKLFACIAVNHLGVDKDIMPLYDPKYNEKSERVLAEIVNGGNFGYYSEAYKRAGADANSLKYALVKVRNVTDYFFSLFSLMPVEAIFLYFSRLYYGIIAFRKRSNQS